MPKTSKKSIRNDRVPCRFIAVRRAAYSCNYTNLYDVRDAAKIPAHTWRRMKSGKAVDEINYIKLGQLLNCEPTTFMKLEAEVIPQGDIRRAFADRIDQLVYQQKIPETLRGERTDVVRFVWHMGDYKIDGMKITYEEQREAYVEILRNEYGTLKECYPKADDAFHPMINRMEINPNRFEDYIGDMEWRRRTAKLVTITLERFYELSDERFIYEDICTKFERRFKLYLDAVAQDIEQRNAQTNPNEPWDANAIRRVVDADYRVRMSFLESNSETDFERAYQKSRRLIHLAKQKNELEFTKWWPRYRDDNTTDLQDMKRSLTSPPDFDAFHEAVISTIRRTEVAINNMINGAPLSRVARERIRDVSHRPF